MEFSRTIHGQDRRQNLGVRPYVGVTNRGAVWRPATAEGGGLLENNSQGEWDLR